MPITTSKRIIYNTLLNVITNIVTAFIGFCLIRFFLGKLGEQRYGVWVLIASVFQYRMLLCLGLNSAINWHIPVFLAKHNDEGVAKVASTAFFFLLFIGVILAALTILVYFNLGNWFEIQPEQIDTARILVLIVGFSFSLAAPLQMSSAILSGIQRYDITNSITLIFLISRTILLILLLTQGCGLLTMGFIFGGSEIMMQMVQFIFSKKLLPQAIISVHHLDFKLLKEMTAYGINTILYTMGALILYKASDIIIGIFLGTAQISRFSIAVAAVFLLSELTQVFSSAVKPAVSDLNAREDNAKVREIAFLTQKYTLLMLIPASCFFVLMGKNFLSVWVGGKIHDDTVLNMMAAILAIMTIGQAIRLAQHSNFIVLVGLGEHKIFGVFTLITAVLFVIISVVCLKVLKMGLISVAWSNFIPVVLFSGILLQGYFNKKMQIPFKDTVSRVGIPSLRAVLPAVVLILAWKYVAAPDSWIKLVGVAIAAAVTTMVASWFLAFSKGERQRFLRIVVKPK